MMGSNSSGGGGGPGGGMAPGMGGPVGGGGDGRHDDETALTEFLSSLMDYTPTVWCHHPPLAFSTFLSLGLALMLGSVVLKIPDELVEHYLGRSGFNCPDLRL